METYMMNKSLLIRRSERKSSNLFTIISSTYMKVLFQLSANFKGKKTYKVIGQTILQQTFDYIKLVALIFTIAKLCFKGAQLAFIDWSKGQLFFFEESSFLPHRISFQPYSCKIDNKNSAVYDTGLETSAIPKQNNSFTWVPSHRQIGHAVYCTHMCERGCRSQHGTIFSIYACRCISGNGQVGPHLREKRLGKAWYKSPAFLSALRILLFL